MESCRHGSQTNPATPRLGLVLPLSDVLLHPSPASASPSIPNHGRARQRSLSQPHPALQEAKCRTSAGKLLRLHNIQTSPPPLIYFLSHILSRMCRRCSGFPAALSLLSYLLNFPSIAILPFSFSIFARSTATSTASCPLVSLACYNKIRGLESSQRRDLPQRKADV